MAPTRQVSPHRACAAKPMPIGLALSCAGVTADSIGYVEAHGTGTHLGDPIEVEALTRAFRATTERSQYCWLGSVKSNFGHLVAGSGVAGLIKAALALHHGKIPPTLHFSKPNPEIDFSATPFNSRRSRHCVVARRPAASRRCKFVRRGRHECARRTRREHRRVPMRSPDARPRFLRYPPVTKMRCAAALRL